MNTVRMILCGNVEDSRMNPSEQVGVVSVVFVSTEEEKIKNQLKKLQDKNPEKLNETIPIKLKIPIKEINKHIFTYLSSKIIFLLQSLIFSSVLLI